MEIIRYHVEPKQLGLFVEVPGLLVLAAVGPVAAPAVLDHPVVLIGTFFYAPADHFDSVSAR